MTTTVYSTWETNSTLRGRWRAKEDDTIPLSFFTEGKTGYESSEADDTGGVRNNENRPTANRWRVPSEGPTAVREPLAERRKRMVGVDEPSIVGPILTASVVSGDHVRSGLRHHMDADDFVGFVALRDP